MTELERLAEGSMLVIPVESFNAIWSVVLAAREIAERTDDPELCAALHRLCEMHNAGTMQ